MKVRSVPLLAALIAMSAAASAADATDPQELRALRDEVTRLRDAYEKRIDALEKRLAQAETAAAKAQSSAVEAASQAVQAESAARVAGRRPDAENAFNPAISMVLSGMYTNLKNDPAVTPYAIGGFVPSLGEVAPPARGFSLGESEVTIAANIDHHFRGALTLALPPEEGEAPAVEEAFIQTLGLGHGLTAKAGRYLSGIGYMNEQHAHAWDFSDAPLAYKAFFGNQLRGEGVQLKWLAPTDTFLEFGVEGGRGGAFPSAERNKNGFQTGALFAHVGGDAGSAGSWRAGLSYVKAEPESRAYEDSDAAGTATSTSFTGHSKTWVADAVWKWLPGSGRGLTLQAEYFRRTEDGMLATDAAACLLAPCQGDYRSVQSGWYAQAVYRFLPAWRVGYRYDRLDSGSLANALAADPASGLSAADFPILAAHKPQRNTLMLDWSPSEFSRLRLQYARDASQANNPDNQLWLHYIVTLGAHGAHKF
ncbi:MAG: TonB-dependent receptor [Sterolibacterium sp.]|jgi:hypothetical protein